MTVSLFEREAGVKQLGKFVHTLNFTGILLKLSERGSQLVFRLRQLLSPLDYLQLQICIESPHLVLSLHPRSCFSHYLPGDGHSDGGCNQNGKHEHGEGEGAGPRVLSAVLAAGPVHLIHFQFQECGPGGMILEQSGSGFLDHDGASCLNFVFVEKDMQRPQIALYVRASRAFHHRQHLFLRRGVTLSFNLRYQFRDALRIRSSGGKEGIDMPLLAEQEDFHCDTTILTGIGESFSRQLQFDPPVSKVVEQIRVDLVHSAEREEANANQNGDQEAKGQAQLRPDVVGCHGSLHRWLRRYVQATSGPGWLSRRAALIGVPMHRSGALPETECGSSVAGQRKEWKKKGSEIVPLPCCSPVLETRNQKLGTIISAASAAAPAAGPAVADRAGPWAVPGLRR